jgi:hypothetical protein
VSSSHSSQGKTRRSRALVRPPDGYPNRFITRLDMLKTSANYFTHERLSDLPYGLLCPFDGNIADRLRGGFQLGRKLRRGAD